MRLLGQAGFPTRVATLVVALAALFVAVPLPAEDGGQILYHEPLWLLPAPDEAGTDHLIFDALGRRFELLLTPNRRLQRHRLQRDYDLMRGELAGLPDSWVRLTRRGDRLSGLFFDGEALYAIEPWADISEQSVAGGDNDGATNAVYRLRDVLMPAGTASCSPAVAGASVRGDMAFAQLGEELADLPPVLRAEGATRRIELRAVTDYEFYQRWGVRSEDEVLSRMNIVDGIFSDQLGLQIDVAAVEVFDTPADPFTSNVAGDLLDEVVDYRVSRATGEGLTHLFSWRELSGSTRGIAYLGSACSNTFAASLSQQLSSTMTFGALITAHEIGHNLDAQHDGEVSTDPVFPNPCDTVPQTFLMAPTIIGTDQFSQCSLDVMADYLDRQPTSCVTGVGPYLADVPASLRTGVDTPRTLSFSVINIGGPATGVELSLTWPASLDVQTQSAGCTLAQGSALCDLGDMADGAELPLSFDVQSATAGTYSMILALATDFVPDSDRATVNINVQTSAAAQGGGGGGGGGGSLSPLAIALLVCGAWARRRRSAIRR